MGQNDIDLPGKLYVQLGLSVQLGLNAYKELEVYHIPWCKRQGMW